MRLSLSEKYRRLHADITKRNESVARRGPVWSEPCSCDGRKVLTLYGHAMVATPDGTGPGPDTSVCAQACSFVRLSEQIVRERGHEISFRKFKKLMGSKLEVAGLSDRVGVDSGVVDARLVATLLRNLDAKRVRVAVEATAYDHGTPSLHVVASDGSWVMQVAGMKQTNRHETWPEPSRRARWDELAGLRQRNRKGRR